MKVLPQRKRIHHFQPFHAPQQSRQTQCQIVNAWAGTWFGRSWLHRKEGSRKEFAIITVTVSAPMMKKFLLMLDMMPFYLGLRRNELKNDRRGINVMTSLRYEHNFENVDRVGSTDSHSSSPITFYVAHLQTGTYTWSSFMLKCYILSSDVVSVSFAGSVDKVRCHKGQFVTLISQSKCVLYSFCCPTPT